MKLPEYKQVLCLNKQTGALITRWYKLDAATGEYNEVPFGDVPVAQLECCCGSSEAATYTYGELTVEPMTTTSTVTIPAGAYEVLVKNAGGFTSDGPPNPAATGVALVNGQGVAVGRELPLRAQKDEASGEFLLLPEINIDARGYYVWILVTRK